MTKVDEAEFDKFSDDQNPIAAADPDELLDGVRWVIRANEFHDGIVENALVMLLTHLMLIGYSFDDLIKSMKKAQMDCKAILADLKQKTEGKI